MGGGGGWLLLPPAAGGSVPGRATRARWLERAVNIASKLVRDVATTDWSMAWWSVVLIPRLARALRHSLSRMDPRIPAVKVCMEPSQRGRCCCIFPSSRL